jgi:hypothetical protein
MPSSGRGITRNDLTAIGNQNFFKHELSLRNEKLTSLRRLRYSDHFKLGNQLSTNGL